MPLTSWGCNQRKNHQPAARNRLWGTASQRQVPTAFQSAGLESSLSQSLLCCKSHVYNVWKNRKKAHYNVWKNRGCCLPMRSSAQPKGLKSFQSRSRNPGGAPGAMFVDGSFGVNPWQLEMASLTALWGIGGTCSSLNVGTKLNFWMKLSGTSETIPPCPIR